LGPPKIKDGYITIHGHFYQPPRENPWLEIIETEESAHPFHDWNERITFECYRPNAHARIVDSAGKILEILNNYSLISFNFGPTLLPWLERKFPSVYQKILDADREGFKQFGHGNALAQVYNHVIMPLANEHDKGTEVLWGIADFEKRFHRRPEAMWLPETAVDYPTLRVLVKHGMRYLILSPFQALRFRPLGGKRWVDVSQGRIDPTQPYRCFIRDASGKKVSDQSIDIFFYDGMISKEVAFGDLLKDGNAFCKRFSLAYEPSKKRPQLIHIATDGETYGHHKKFGDMALAYALEEGFSSRGFEVINYGAFLKRFPPVYEVEIDEGPKGEGTSWSCAHGVDRWKEDCGCSTGGRTGWNQKWREPLREALNLVRDELVLIFEKEGEKIFKDVWEARNGYIDVILDRSPENLGRFFDQAGLKGLHEEGRIKGLKLLEMERHALQMYTSCGWFFADLAGLETIIVLQHAARAMELAQDVAGKDIEGMFLDHLSKAKSNLPEMGDGRQVYQRLVKPRSVTLDKVVNHYAISSLFSQEEKEKNIFSYRIEKVNGERMEKDDSWLVLGQVRVTPETISESKGFFFGLIPSTKDIFRTWISEDDKEIDFNLLKEKSLQSLGKSEDEMAETLTSLLGDHVLTIRETFKEERQGIFQKLIEKELKEHYHSYAELFDKTRQAIEALAREGFEIPYEIRVAAEVTLSDRLLQEIRELKGNFSKTIKRGEIDRIVEEAKEHSFQLRKEESIRILNEMLKEEMESLQRTVIHNRAVPTKKFEVQEERVEKVIQLLDLAKRWGFELPKEEPQNSMGEILAECLGNLEECWWGDGVQRKTLPPQFITLAEKLGFNVEKLSKMVGSSISADQSTTLD
jgi:alpha-amylase/alpha-mannosidase (GH57 family)